MLSKVTFRHTSDLLNLFHTSYGGYNLAYDRTPKYTGGIISTVTPDAPLDPPIRRTSNSEYKTFLMTY